MRRLKTIKRKSFMSRFPQTPIIDIKGKSKLLCWKQSRKKLRQWNGKDGASFARKDEAIKYSTSIFFRVHIMIYLYVSLFDSGIWRD